MPTPFESTQLILTLYEQRREATMREARSWWISFDPQSIEDYTAALLGPRSGFLRMVISYWDMAASFVENNAIDRKMFCDSTIEFLVVYAKLEALLPEIRQKFSNPNLARHLEALVLSMPDARTQIDGAKARVKAMAAARKAAASAQA